METKIVLQRHTKLGRISAGARSALIARAEFGPVVTSRVKLGLVLLVGGLTDEEQNNVATSLTVRITIKLLTLRNILCVNVTPGLHRH